MLQLQIQNTVDLITIQIFLDMHIHGREMKL